MKKNPLYDLLGQYPEWEKIITLLNLLGALKKYPIELIIVKHLYLCGVNTEEKLVELLTKTEIDYATKVSLQNSMRDISLLTTNFEDVPSLPKFK